MSIIAAFILALALLLPNHLYQSLTKYAVPTLILLLVCMIWLVVFVILAIITGIKKASAK
jgi:hypothetical protein